MTAQGCVQGAKPKKRVFVSFASEDLAQVRGLRLLKDNPDFELDFYDESVREPIHSRNAEYINRVIREKIRRCSVTVCLISETTHKSDWVEWELETSAEERNRIIAMALKGVESAVLPTLIRQQGLTFHPWNPAGLGVLVVVLEGLQSLNQFHHNWITYRSTCEELKHEKFLWLAKAGPYAASANPDVLLAERVESLISREHAKWVSAREHVEKEVKSGLESYGLRG